MSWNSCECVCTCVWSWKGWMNRRAGSSYWPRPPGASLRPRRTARTPSRRAGGWYGSRWYGRRRQSPPPPPAAAAAAARSRGSPLLSGLMTQCGKQRTTASRKHPNTQRYSFLSWNHILRLLLRAKSKWQDVWSASLWRICSACLTDSWATKSKEFVIIFIIYYYCKVTNIIVHHELVQK